MEKENKINDQHYLTIEITVYDWNGNVLGKREAYDWEGAEENLGKLQRMANKYTYCRKCGEVLLNTEGIDPREGSLCGHCA